MGWYTDPDLVRVAEKTASMPKIFGSQLIAGTEVVKDRSQSHPKILDRSGAVDDNVGVQEQGTMQAIQNITDGCGGAAGLKPGDLSPEQSGLHGGSLAVLRDRRVQRVAQLGSASPLGGEGRGIEAHHADVQADVLRPGVLREERRGEEAARPQVDREARPQGSRSADLEERHQARGSDPAAVHGVRGDQGGRTPPGLCVPAGRSVAVPTAPQAASPQEISVTPDPRDVGGGGSDPCGGNAHGSFSTSSSRDVLSRDSGPGTDSHVAPGLSVGVGHDCPAHIDDQLAATASEVAGALRRTRKGTSRMMALLALAASVAASAQVIDTARGYANPKDCWLGSGAASMPTIALCIDKCDSACPQWLAECSQYYLGNVPASTFIRDMKNASIRLSENRSDNVALDVKLIQVGQLSSDELVRNVAIGLAGETTFCHIQ